MQGAFLFKQIALLIFIFSLLVFILTLCYHKPYPIYLSVI
jgi:hypothetical protein